jgi:hypothetical protein
MVSACNGLRRGKVAAEQQRMLCRIIELSRPGDQLPPSVFAYTVLAYTGGSVESLTCLGAATE